MRSTPGRRQRLSGWPDSEPSVVRSHSFGCPVSRLLCSITATPAMIFYSGGKPLTIRRTGHADSEVFVGSVSKEAITELFQTARATENDGGRILNADC